MSLHTPVCASCPHTSSAESVDQKDEEEKKLRPASLFKKWLAHQPFVWEERQRVFSQIFLGMEERRKLSKVFIKPD